MVYKYYCIEIYFLICIMHFFNRFSCFINLTQILWSATESYINDDSLSYLRWIDLSINKIYILVCLLHTLWNIIFPNRPFSSTWQWWKLNFGKTERFLARPRGRTAQLGEIKTANLWKLSEIKWIRKELRPETVF